RVDGSFLGIDDLTTRLNYQRIGQGSLPFGIDGFYQLVFIVDIEDIVRGGSLGLLQELQRLIAFGGLVGADTDELEIPAAVHAVDVYEIGELGHTGTTPGSPHIDQPEL